MEDRVVPVAKSVQTVLFVDLDGTLIKGDLLWEAFFAALKREPWILFAVPLWLLQGRAQLKHAIAKRALPNAAALPYHDDVIAYLHKRREQGSRLILATASNHRWANPVASELGLFDDIIASDSTTNLKGSRKLAAIEAYCREHGIDAWGYVGDTRADEPIWAKAREVLVVTPSARLLARLRRRAEPLHIFGRRGSRIQPIIKALRPHQWVKNVLLFVPLLLSRQFTEPDKVLAALAAFTAFSCCASSVYVMNDLLDVEADRMHPRKRHRPFAAGTLPLLWGPLLAAGLVTIAAAISISSLPSAYAIVLVAYLVINTLYSTTLKSKLIVDVLVLASLYTLRILAGGIATTIAVSEWLLAFSIFMFTSLAFAKRYVEMTRVASEGKTAAAGRGYDVGDLSLIESVGPTSGYLAVLVFALYIQDGLPDFYTYKFLLWASCPLMLYWITRLWFLAKRGVLHDDPVVFAVTDKVSLAVGATVGALIFFAAPLSGM